MFLLAPPNSNLALLNSFQKLFFKIYIYRISFFEIELNIVFKFSFFIHISIFRKVSEQQETWRKGCGREKFVMLGHLGLDRANNMKLAYGWQ
jgi:hypothetical protein